MCSAALVCILSAQSPATEGGRPSGKRPVAVAGNGQIIRLPEATCQPSDGAAVIGRLLYAGGGVFRPTPGSAPGTAGAGAARRGSSLLAPLHYRKVYCRR